MSINKLDMTCLLFQVHGDYAKEDIGTKLDRPAEDEAMAGQEVAAAE